ncbi:helix-turn-helix transcriptional regulator [bacterium]|jgi:transcriptional regulator with XRE-family HTH domain|nr:helix-turn-helix transcriptional regulator [bacterium]
MDITKTIKQRREELGITQEKLADIALVSLRTLKAIESGKSNPTINSISKIADILGLDLKLEVKNR